MIHAVSFRSNTKHFVVKNIYFTYFISLFMDCTIGQRGYVGWYLFNYKIIIV